MTIKDKVCPNIVGVDIGCGMYTVKLLNKEIDFKKVDEVCSWIPSGMNVWDSPIESFDLKELKCYSSLKKLSYLEKSLGTLVGGIILRRLNSLNQVIIIWLFIQAVVI